MHHLFIVTREDKSKLVTVEGSYEYAIQYISGYIQALRDQYGKLVSIEVAKAPNSTVNKPEEVRS